MAKVNKIVIIGHFGGRETFTDGQTVKTRTLYDGIKAYTNWKIKVVDTYYKKRRPLKLLFESFTSVLFSKRIIVMLSGNGMKLYFPFLSFSAKLFRKKVYHDVIGGNLDEYIAKNHKFVKYLNSFEWNFVETNTLKNKVESFGIKNCLVIPNFKNINPLNHIDSTSKRIPYTFCTFSRVMKEKGIEDAIKAIVQINDGANCVVCSLDIYGPIDTKYKNDFYKLLINHSNCVTYKGIVPPEESVDVLKNYYFLLFPTYWKGEGFPGTIIDSFASGIPVIASNWGSNSEIVCSGKTGYIYSKTEELKEIILKSISLDDDVYLTMKSNCLTEAINYNSQFWLEKLIRFIETDSVL